MGVPFKANIFSAFTVSFIVILHESSVSILSVAIYRLFLNIVNSGKFVETMGLPVARDSKIFAGKIDFVKLLILSFRVRQLANEGIS